MAALEEWEKWTIDTDIKPQNTPNESGGGASACGLEACANDICGAAACGVAAGYANVCVLDACVAAACGVDGSLVSACGAAASGIAVCGQDFLGAGVCGADACGAAVGGIGACGADACIAAACGAAACGAAACGAAACGADACGIGGCVTNACAADAGGIESLSNHLLRLMNKGTTALQNVFFMKCCREYGILVNWNNLIRFPGEKREDYVQMEEWIRKLVHLVPPAGGSPKIECHRFSPYFNDKERWMETIQPSAWYAGLFPSDRFDLSRLAYYFEAQWKDTLADEIYDGVVAAVLEWIRIWREALKLPQLTYYYAPDGGLFVEDTRWGRSTVWTFNAAEASVYHAIDSPITLKQLLKQLQGTPAQSLTPAQVESVLERFVSAELALCDERFYLGIAVALGTVDPPFEFRRCQFAKEPANQLSTSKKKPEVAIT